MKIDIKIDEQERHKDGLAVIGIEVPDLNVSRELDLSFTDLYSHCRVPDELVLDLLIIASLVYVVDKTVPRSTSFDFWTRSFEIRFPVAEPGRWRAVSGDFERTLNFLTGDTWKLTFSRRQTNLFVAPSRKGKRKPLPEKLENIRAVCSLSGGTDSLTGAVDLLENSNAGRVHLIGHYDAPGAKKPQRKLFDAIKTAYPQKAHLSQVRVSHVPLKAKEATLRSRSLVFMAVGIFAARATGPGVPLMMPENGFIAMNVPLTPGRVGSCSTRTMHPYYLEHLKKTLTGLGIQNPIVNPLEFKTKGECIASSPNLGLLRSILDETVSCSHGTRKQYWTRRERDVRNCGYCVPCIVRRAAMHKVGLDRGDHYGLDLGSGEIDYDDEHNRANDLRAVIDSIAGNRSQTEIEKLILAVAPVDRLADRAGVVERGIDEIKTFLSDKGSGKLRRTLGI